MISAQVVETSVKVTPNSPSQDYSHPDDHNLRTYVVTSVVEILKIIIEILKAWKKARMSKRGRNAPE